LRAALAYGRSAAVRIESLHATNLRCFERFEFAPEPGINWLVGANGAGKTTILEAAYLLSHGRSFRPGGRFAPTRRGTHGYLIHAEIVQDGRHRRLGLARTEDHWEARLDGSAVPSLAPLFAACPVVFFGPESQALIAGPAEERRSFLDWSVFHVEHDSLDAWRTWRRALRQRNALLRGRATEAELDAWEHDLSRLGERIHAMRSQCLASLEPYLVEEADALIPELGKARIEYRAGWDQGLGLARQLSEQRDRDRERGFTQRGVHRADWWLQFPGIPRREHLSRGQAKAVALVCVLAQTRWLKDRVGEYPLLCLDDLGSELDAAHAAKVVAWLRAEPLQAWLTSTSRPEPSQFGGERMFHVEHSQIARA
jgi:DNA replication and repair protein RecF